MTSLKKLIIVCGGGFAREVIWLARECNEWEIIGILDDTPNLQGQIFCDVPVLGTIEEWPTFKETFFVVRGRDLESGLPKSVKLSSGEIREALSDTVNQIVNDIKETLEETPPELISDIMERGIVMAGGGSLLVGIDKVISEETKMNVVVADDPLTCVVRGCGAVLSDHSLLNKIRLTTNS